MGPFLFPDIDPIALELGPFIIRWYSLAYIAGLIGGWQYCMYLSTKVPLVITRKQVDDFLVWNIIGVIVGGRLGHVFFYYPGYYLANPVEIFEVWKGGMSFHGGMLGVTAAMFLYAWRQGLNVLWLSDLVSVAVPMGLGLGRVANFVNQELWGRVTDVPWAVIFPRAGLEPRHPSQLYEAALEGIVLFAILFYLTHAKQARLRPGVLTGTFLIGYALSRSLVEAVREPEILEATLPFGTTWGQWLSLPMALFGIYLIWRAFKKPALKAK